MGLLDLFRPKWKHSDLRVRWDEVKKITDQKVLTDIAKNGEDSYTRGMAVKNITDQNVLSDIIKNDKHWDVRVEAVKNITDQNMLVEIAKNDVNFSVRHVALEKIVDPDIRNQIVQEDKSRDLSGLLAADEKKKKRKTYNDLKADYCGICGKNCAGLPIMKHRLTGLNCCEDCGRIIGGVSNFVILAAKASQCSNCNFLYISSYAKFNICPHCGQPFK
jgi:flavoprotein